MLNSIVNETGFLYAWFVCFNIFIERAVQTVQQTRCTALSTAGEPNTCRNEVRIHVVHCSLYLCPSFAVLYLVTELT